jgi:hypothetical protein
LVRFGDDGGNGGVEIILDILMFGVIFGALATGPLIAWFALAWLTTDRRRSSTPGPDSS